MKGLKGCTHLIIRDGEIKHVFTHLNKLPENGVVHLKADKIYTFEEFKQSHTRDHEELNPQENKINKGGF